MVGRTLVIVLGGVLASRGIARADTPVLGPPVTNRNYAIELYQNGAIGDDTVIAMGGAAVANSFGSSGTLVNPSASAVRQTTDTDRWGWDYHLGYLNSTLSTDYDNTGVTSADAGTSAFTGGLALRIGDWAVAGTLTVETTHVASTSPLVAQVEQSKLAIAHWIPRLELAIGIAAQFGEFELRQDNAAQSSLFTFNGGGLEAFGQHELQRSGEHPAYSMRGGVEYEWLPGRLRLRGGSYWEPGRFEDVGGRIHGTFGLEVRAFEFWLFGPRRGQLTLTGDVAARYDNVGLSIGFWH